MVDHHVEGIEAPREGGGLAQLVRGNGHRVQDIVEAAVGKELRLGERRYRDPAPRAARLQRPELQLPTRVPLQGQTKGRRAPSTPQRLPVAGGERYGSIP